MKIKLKDLKVGDAIEVMANFGQGPMVTGKIVEIDPEGKNGHPVVDYANARGSESWAYIHQIVRKVS